MSNTKAPLCMNCLHFRPAKLVRGWTLADIYASHECSASPYSASIEPVTGSILQGGFRSCISRRRNVKSKCGPDGKEFVAAA